MCGRYSLFSDSKKLAKRFGATVPLETWAPRYNASPSTPLPVVLKKNETNEILLWTWGLMPEWSKSAIINARAETVSQKPAFRGIFRTQRCLVPANGFFEWQKTIPGKSPYYFSLKSGEPFSMAGIWSDRKDTSGNTMPSFSIITTKANSLLQNVHDRMPLILSMEDEQLWLNPSACEERLANLLSPFRAEFMEARKVSKRVNSPRHDDPSIILPL